MRQPSSLLFVTISFICAAFCIATDVHAQEVPATPDETIQQPETASPTDESPQAIEVQEKTFQEIMAAVRKNESQINRLFSTIPIGFPKKQVEHMDRIKALKKTNEVLKSQLEAAAIQAFKTAPEKNRGASRLVFNTLIRKLEVTPANPVFDPQGALKLAEMMLESNLDTDPPGPVRLEEVAYQAFLASYALEDFERANKMLKIIEDKGINLQETLRKELIDADDKWQRELMIRRLESNTDDLPRVKLETSEGDIVVELFENHAPQTVGNFISLVEKNFYNDLSFFLVKPGGIAQTGCPVGDGSTDAGYQIPCECYREQIRHHFTGTLSMANSGRDTGSSQFFITHQRNGQFDGQFTAFGRVIEGMDVVYRLKIADGTKPENLRSSSAPPASSITKATVIRKRNHPYTPTRVAKKTDN